MLVRLDPAAGAGLSRSRWLILAITFFNQLATTGCMGAGTAYDIDLPADKVPTAACQVHGGEQWPFAQQIQGLPQKAGTFPGRLFRSFRRLFGGP